jgi:hypothetical protein
VESGARSRRDAARGEPYAEWYEQKVFKEVLPAVSEPLRPLIAETAGMADSRDPRH